jgi:hypothetical protein
VQTTTADVPRLGRPPGRLIVDRRLMGIALVTEAMALALAYLAVYVPVLGPKLTEDEANRHWLAAAVSGLVVVSFGALVVTQSLRARRRAGPLQAELADDVEHGVVLPRIPQGLQFERVPPAWLKRAVAFSLATLPFSVALGAPLWLAWLAILAPWFPIIALEAQSKYARHPLFACFGLLVILQSLHMVEHSTQITQLLLTGGTLAQSHGVIGQLDFESTHMVADTILWLTVGWLAIKFLARNKWLWVAFAAASMHEVEHLYLFWLYAAEHTVYLSGGAAGIMGHYGLIGSPLDRPYLHYTYNFIVTVPLLVAFWDEARHTDRVDRIRAKRKAKAEAAVAT